MKRNQNDYCKNCSINNYGMFKFKFNKINKKKPLCICLMFKSSKHDKETLNLKTWHAMYFVLFISYEFPPS